MLSRRRFLTFAALAPTVRLLGGCSLLSTEILFAAACNDTVGNHYVGCFDGQGNIISKVRLPERAHGLVLHPQSASKLIVFGRRPSRHFWVVDFVTGSKLAQVTVEKNHHLYGHGTTSVSHNLLWTTEQHFPTGRGLVVGRDIDSMMVKVKYHSGGIGPHELHIIESQQRLVVANGGILTHPAHQRQKLNLDTMQPNLTVIDINNGSIVDSATLPNHQSSIRHLDCTECGVSIVGIQHQRHHQTVPLVAIYKESKGLTYLPEPTESWGIFNDYIGSVVIDKRNNLVAVSSPKGHCVAYWELDSLKYRGMETFKDVCGIAAVPSGGLVATTGRGYVLPSLPTVTVNELLQTKQSNLQWDNHLVALAKV